MEHEEYTHFIIPIITIILVALYFLPDVNAFTTIEVTPVKGSRIPGCQNEQGCFTPNDIEVKVGTLIIFKNTDETMHSFTSNKFNSQLMINNGQEYNWVVESGKVEYSCLLHPWAVGTITGFDAPKLENFNTPPIWVNNLFDWYNDDVIDYNTFINVIIYLMSYDIITEYEEPEPKVIERTTNNTNSDCDNARGVTLRKQLGCDIPQEDTRTIEQKCKDVYSNIVRKELGCS
jgi:plastocyanin